MLIKEQFEGFYETVMGEAMVVGNMDEAVHANIGDKRSNVYAKAVDDNGRRAILVGTAMGNIVVFEEHAEGQGPFSVACTVPQEMGQVGILTDHPNSQDLRAMANGVVWGLFSDHANGIVTDEDLFAEYRRRVYAA